MLLWERRRGEADARHVQKQPYRMRGGKVPVEKSEEVGDPVQVVPPALKVPMNLRRKTRMHKETLGKWSTGCSIPWVHAVISLDVVVRPCRRTTAGKLPL